MAAMQVVGFSATLTDTPSSIRGVKPVFSLITEWPALPPEPQFQHIVIGGLATSLQL